MTELQLNVNTYLLDVAVSRRSWIVWNALGNHRVAGSGPRAVRMYSIVVSHSASHGQVRHVCHG